MGAARCEGWRLQSNHSFLLSGSFSLPLHVHRSTVWVFGICFFRVKEGEFSGHEVSEAAGLKSQQKNQMNISFLFFTESLDLGTHRRRR